MRISRWGAVALVGALLLAACGDDDGDGDEAAAGAGEHTEYCELSAALDEQDGPPTQEQLEELESVAPEEISDDISFIVDRFEEEGLDAFMDAEVGERFGPIEEWEAENCPGAAERQEENEAAAEPQEPDPDATRVPVVATDFDFSIEGDVPAGKVAFVMQNDGDEPHHMSIIKFKTGTTLEEAEEAVEEGFGAIGDLMESDVGESSDAEPGATAVLNAELEPGVYGMACFVESDGEPHIAKGMRIAFEVN